MPEVVARTLLAAAVAVALGVLLNRRPSLTVGGRDFVLVSYGVVVALLAVFAILGPQAAAVAGVVLLGTAAVGAAIYGLLSLVGRWVERT